MSIYCYKIVINYLKNIIINYRILLIIKLLLIANIMFNFYTKLTKFNIQTIN